MRQAAVCPDLMQYQQLAADQLADADEEAMLEHLERCDACARKLSTLVERDRLVEFIRRYQARGDGAADEVMGRLVERMSKLRPGETPAAAGQTIPSAHITVPVAALIIACPACGKALKVKGELAGKMVKCPHCQQAVCAAAKSAGAPASGVSAAALSVPPRPATVAGAGHQTGANAAGKLENTVDHQPASGTNKELYDFLAPPQAPDELGRLGPYRVLQVLGAGGMGVVFRAEDPQLMRLVALKAMLPALAASASARQRFLREARAAAAIKHDHIVTIYQVGEDRGVPFLAMDFLEGEPLDARLQRVGKLPVAEVVRIGREIALGLAAANQRGLIHRDIKPANIWLETHGAPGASATGGRVKILDFGLARAVGAEAQLTQLGAIVGTPAYMAPEQAQGKSVDHRCDLFSLGCVLYRLATGEPAFRGADVISTLMAVATEHPRPPHELEATLPPALSELIMGLLAKEPGDRPSSAQAVAETLERIAAVGAASRAAPTLSAARLGSPGLQAAPRPRKKWPIVAGLAACLLLGLAGLWSAGVFKLKTKDGTIVLANLPADAEVFVDGEKIAVQLTGDGKRIEIQVAPGTRKLEIKSAGFTMITREVTLAAGERNPLIDIRLEPLAVPSDKPALPREVPSVRPSAADALRRADIPEAVLASIGGGDRKRVPAELVAVLGDGRFRLTGITRFPAFSPDGALLAVPGGGEIFLFDANSGQLLRRFPGRVGRVMSVAFSPNGALLAMADQEIVRLWNPRTGVLLQELSGHAHGYAKSVAFTPDNQSVLSCSNDKTVRVWDVTTGRQTRVLSCKAGVESIAITPDGRLVVAGTFDGHVYGWSPDTGAEKFMFAVGKPVRTGVSVSADGQWLASGTNDELKVWKIADLAKKDRSPFFKKQTPAGGLEFEKNSNNLWTAEHTSHPTGSRVCCWQPASHQLVSSVALRGSGSKWSSNAVSPDGRTLAAFAENESVVQFYDTRTGKPRFPDPGHTREVHSVAFSPDGRWLASGSADNTVLVWDLATGTQRHKLEGHTAPVGSVAFSPDGKLLASGSNDGTIALWDPVVGARVRTLNGHVSWTRVRFSPDSKLVAAGTADGGVRMWYARNGEEARMLRGLHQGSVRCLDFSADGQRLATGGNDGKLVITDLASGKVLQSFKRNTAVTTVEFGGDGETVAAGYNHPESVGRVWNLKDKDFVSLNGHSHHVNSVSLRSDGRLAVTASSDGSVRVWEIGGNLPRKMVLGRGSAGEMLWIGALSPDGRYVATGNTNGTIYLFRLPGPAENVGGWLAARGSVPAGLSPEAWLERVKGLYVGNVPDAIADRLRELNPGFDRQVSPVIEDGVVTELHVSCGKLKDISPLRAWLGLRTLGLEDGGPYADLSPLKGMKLTVLNCGESQVSDLTPLQGMPLKTLRIHATPVSDLAPLQDMKLTSLECYNSRVSDLTPLKNMQLAMLQCAGTLVSDLSPLRGMKLTQLQCHDTQVTGAGLAPLQEMSSLRLLSIGGPKMNEAGLEHLKKLTDLELLILHNMELTDVGLVHLKGLVGLRELHLQRTRVTDAGLEHLAGLKNLAQLTLNGTAVTDKGVAKLKIALPKCNILADGKVPTSEPAATPPAVPTVPPSAALEALRRDQIAPEALKLAGDGDANKAPASLVAVLGEAAPIHSQRVAGLTFSPDGRWLASGSHDKTILLREVATGRVSRVLRGHTGPVSSVAFSKDSRTLVSASHDGTIKLWPVHQEVQPETLQPKLGEIWALAASRDGRFLAAAGTSGAIKLWEWGQWSAALDVPTISGKVTALDFSPDGALLGSGCEEAGKSCTIRLYTTSDGKLSRNLPGHARRVNAVTFSRDGKFLASVGLDPNAKVQELSSGKIVFDVPQFREHANAITFSPDGKKVVVCNGDRQGVIEDIASQKLDRFFAGEWGNLHATAYSPDGKLLAFGGDNGIVHVWDTTTWKQIFLERGHRHHIAALAVSPDGGTVVSAGDDNTLRRWNLAKPGEHRVLRQFPEPVHFVTYSPDGKTFVTAAGLYGWLSHLLIAWDAATLKERTIQEQADVRWPGPHGTVVHLCSLAFSPDGKTIAGCGRALDVVGVHLWDAALGHKVYQFPALGWGLGLAFSADGKQIAVATHDTKTVKIWNVTTGAEVASWKDLSPMRAAAFHPKGTLLATGHEDGLIGLWNPTTGEKLRTLAGHSAPVRSLKFTPDGKTLVSSGDDGIIRLWNPENVRAREVIPLGPANRPLTFDLDPSGKYLFAAGHCPVIFVLRLPQDSKQAPP